MLVEDCRAEEWRYGGAMESHVDGVLALGM